MHTRFPLKEENLNQTDSSALPSGSRITRRWRSVKSRPSIFKLSRCGHGTAGRLSILSRNPPELTSPVGGITCPRNGVAALEATHSVPACASAMVFEQKHTNVKAQHKWRRLITRLDTVHGRLDSNGGHDCAQSFTLGTSVGATSP